MTVLCYPKCSTCKKAILWLEDHGIAYEYRDISKENPTKEELKIWQKRSNLDLKKFFNTSGILYREQNLASKLTMMTEEEMLEILASSGMLVKRPLVVLENIVLVGFKEAEWEKTLL